MIRVDLERCTGCGVCADACPAGAIRIRDGHAAIDEHLCRQCENCVSACPQGALSSVPVIIVPEARDGLLPEPAAPAARPSGATWQGRILPLLGAVADLAVREIFPRVVDAIARATASRQQAHSPTAGAVKRIVGAGRRLRWRQRGR